MRVHFIGHASLFFETEDQGILMDPVFFDPHYEGLCEVSPRREVDTTRLPPYSLVVVSHRHLDHFDVRTLAALDRSCPIVIPEGDAAMLRSVRALGFREIRAVGVRERMQLGRTTLQTTPSKSPVREYGLVVSDASGTTWNLVDTNINNSIASGVAAAFGRIDLLVATWQPLMEAEVFTNEPLGFPYERYFRHVSNVRQIGPGAVVPGSCGFKYVGGSAWLNKFVFPATREMFLRDVARLAPATRTLSADPGDVIEVSGGAAELRAGASGFVRCVLDDSDETAFDPTGAVPELRDPNPEGYDERDMQRAVEGYVRGRLLPALARTAHGRELAEAYRSAGLVYRLDVIFPSAPRTWSIDFAAPEVLLEEGCPAPPHIHARVAASVLTDMIEARHSSGYGYSGGFYRLFARAYVAERHGLYRWTPPGEKGITDPLWLALPEEELLAGYLDREVARHLAQVPAAGPQNGSEAPPLSLTEVSFTITHS